MSAEAVQVDAYVVDCEECDYHSEFYESRYEAELDAEYHNEEKHPYGDDEPDDRSPWERYQAILDIAAGIVNDESEV